MPHEKTRVGPERIIYVHVATEEFRQSFGDHGNCLLHENITRCFTRIITPVTIQDHIKSGL